MMRCLSCPLPATNGTGCLLLLLHMLMPQSQGDVCLTRCSPIPFNSPYSIINPDLPGWPSRKGYESRRWRRHQHGHARHHDGSYLPHCLDLCVGWVEGNAVKIGMPKSSQASTSKPVVRCVLLSCVWWWGKGGGFGWLKGCRLMAVRSQMLSRSLIVLRPTLKKPGPKLYS